MDSNSWCWENENLIRSICQSRETWALLMAREQAWTWNARLPRLDLRAQAFTWELRAGAIRRRQKIAGPLHFGPARIMRGRRKPLAMQSAWAKARQHCF